MPVPRCISVIASRVVRAAANSTGPSSADVKGGRPLTLFIKREGDADWAKVKSTGVHVADLKETAIKVMPSLQGKDLSALTLHVARDAAGRDVGDALDSSDTLSPVVLRAGAKIVVKVADGVVAATGKNQRTTARPVRAIFSWFSLPSLRRCADARDSDKLLRQAILQAEQAGNFITLANGAEWPQLGGCPCTCCTSTRNGTPGLCSR